MISKLVCLGDSLTEAYGIDPENGWTHLLNKEVEFPVINEGISGDTTAGMLARFHGDIREQKPSHMLVMGGSNDCSINMSIETILGNILAITRHAKRIKCHVIIGIPTPCFWEMEDFTSNVFLNPGAMQAKLKEYQNALRNFAIEDELDYIDFSDLLQKEHFLADGVHPNEAGHLTMKNHVFKALNSLSLPKF